MTRHESLGTKWLSYGEYHFLEDPKVSARARSQYDEDLLPGGLLALDADRKTVSTIARAGLRIADCGSPRIYVSRKHAAAAANEIELDFELINQTATDVVVDAVSIVTESWAPIGELRAFTFRAPEMLKGGADRRVELVGVLSSVVGPGHPMRVSDEDLGTGSTSEFPVSKSTIRLVHATLMVPRDGRFGYRVRVTYHGADLKARETTSDLLTAAWADLSGDRLPSTVTFPRPSARSSDCEITTGWSWVDVPD